jgi:subfamily B ATP-binding cassette protein HlyB/CyaB
MTPGQLIAFQMLSARVMGPVLRAAQLWQSFHQVKLSVDRLGDILSARPEPMVRTNSLEPGPMQGALRVDELCFRYHREGPEILWNLSFTVAPGETVYLVGRNGSGKTTLTKLLQGLYVPESGRVYIDGVDLRQVDPVWIRRQVAVVPQTCVVFNGTVRENIALHAPAADTRKIIDAAVLAGAHEFIERLPQGYDTLLGEGATVLSGGQRQQLAIARALFTEPKVLLMDEATDALDAKSERIVFENLERVFSGRTLIVVTHRMPAAFSNGRILIAGSGPSRGTRDTSRIDGQTGGLPRLILATK